MATLVAALAVGACDTSFQPIAESEVRFSVFGYLDAAADTQWIRVMPIRPLATTSPGPAGTSVTLEDLRTGRVVTLRDSLLRFFDHGDRDVGYAGSYVHDFWTTERIEPGGTYRFSASREGGAPAEAVVEVPRDYAVQMDVSQNPPWELDQLRIVGSKHLPFLKAYAYFFDRCGSGVDSVTYEARPDDQEVAALSLRKESVRPRENCGAPTLERRTLWVVGSESAWPSGNTYSPLGLATPERASNVTNAVGFLGGVFTKEVPYESCSFDPADGPVPAYCRLRYDEASAAITGTLRESRCGDGVIGSVTIQLKEIVPPPTMPRIRTVVSDRAGGFTVGALEAGMRYALKARAKPIPIFGIGEIDIYALHYDTLTFTPGELRRYDIGLDRLTPCDQKP